MSCAATRSSATRPTCRSTSPPCWTAWSACVAAAAGTPASDDAGAVRLIAWNIRAGGGVRVAAIGRQLQRWAPDVVALSEFRATPPSGLLRRALAESGLAHQLATAD